MSLIGSPSGCAGGEVGLSFGGDHDGPIVFMAETVSAAPRIVVFEPARIGETEDRSRSGRLVGKRSCLAAVIRGCGLGRAVRGQVAATHDAMPGIAERHRGAAGVGVAHEW